MSDNLTLLFQITAAALPIIYLFIKYSCRKNGSSNGLRGIIQKDSFKALKESYDMIFSANKAAIKVRDGRIKELEEEVARQKGQIQELQAIVKLMKEQIAALIAAKG